MENNKLLFVPVVDNGGKPLMPTTPSRAKRWIKSGKATPFWKKGVFCVRLNQEPSGREIQQIAVGIDPGSKKEGFTVKSRAHTYLNIQADAVTWVKESVSTRRDMRRGRRFRKTPCRQPRANNNGQPKIPPSTKSRWDWKLRICKWLALVFPVTDFIVEDIKAVTKKGKNGKWNRTFSPLEVGKKWLYDQLKLIGKLSLRLGYETFELRKALGLKKSSGKLKEVFSAHAIDSWVLANSVVGGHCTPDNEKLLCISPIQLHRRQLHALQFKEGVRRPYGSTRSLGFKRGSLVKHSTYGLTYVGGTSKGRISLHSVENGKRLSQSVKVEDCRLLSYGGIKYHYV